MDKLLARAARARAQAARRAARHSAQSKKAKEAEARTQYTEYNNSLYRLSRQSRLETKEDKRLGPLSPRRAVGEVELETFGALDQSQIIPPAVPEAYRIKRWNIAVGDRVVVLVGLDRHKIGKVKQVDKDNNTLIIEKCNMVPMKVPDVFLDLGQSKERVVWREAPVHYRDVRLVFPVPDQTTGEVVDSVVANIAMSRIWYDRGERTERWTRYVAGTAIEIPWPEKPEEEHLDRKCDTKIMDVEAKTWVPGLKDPPIPEGVIDELRNKYSKFRTRHEQWYIDKMEAEEKKGQERDSRVVRTPLQEWNKLLREERKKKGWPGLDESMLELIGRKMAEKKPELLEKVKIGIEIQKRLEDSMSGEQGVTTSSTLTTPEVPLDSTSPQPTA